MNTERDDKRGTAADALTGPDVELGGSVNESQLDGPLDNEVTRELAKLGEGPLAPAERRFSEAGAGLNEDGDVTAVDLLIGIGHRFSDTTLDELGSRRVWSRIDSRIDSRIEAQLASRREVSAAQPEACEPAANSAALRTVLVGFAVAASLVIVPRLVPQTAADPQERQAQRDALAVLGSSARAGLGRLPGETDTARATSLAAAYGARLADRESDEGSE